MTFIDMFSGMGTARMAFEQAGHNCAYSIEWDKHKRRIYEVIFGAEPTGRDIRDVRGGELPRANVWIAGFPCQDISVAGKQLGFDGARSSLFFEVMRLLQEIQEEVKPKYLLFENVKNFFSVNDGHDFATALSEMDSCGYDSEWDLLNSKNFGVPQNRERVFIVGHLRGRSTRKVFPISGSDGVFTERYGQGPGQSQYSTCLTKNYAKGVHNQGETYIQIVGAINSSQDGKVFDTNGISQCLSAGHGNMPKIEVRAVLTPDRANKNQNGRRFKDDGEPMFTLTGQDRHGVELRQLIPGSDAQRVYDSEGLARTLKAEGGGQGAKTGLYQVEQSRIRRLTPRECFRLQAVPEEIIDKILAAGISDTQCYRAAGDAMTVSVVYEIAKRM